MEKFKKKIYLKKSPVNYPKRPKISNNPRNEKRITVYCNLKRFNFDNGFKNKHIMQYSIHYEPVIAEDNYPLKRTIIKQLKEDLEGNFEKYFQAGDTLYICSQNAKEQLSLETKVKEVLYKATFVRTSNYIDCTKITTHTIANLKLKNFLESMIKSIIYSNNHIVRFDNRTFYDYHDSENIVEGSNNGKIWHGYSTAVCITEAGLFLRINDKNKLITGKTAYEKMLEIAKNNGGNLLDPNIIREIAEYFRGKTVIAQYGTYRAYRIGEVTMDQNVNNTSLTMRTRDGNQSYVTIKEYYKNQYNIDIKYEDQPLLVEELRKINVNSENSEIRIRYLIPELVYLTGMDEIDERERNSILEKSKPQPSKKVELMEKGFKYLRNKEKRKIKKKNKIIELKSPEEVRDEWGINFEQNFTEVEARCLDLPNIIFGNSNNTEIVMNRGRFRQLKDISPVDFNKDNCMLITFDTLVDTARKDCEQMKIASEAFGIKFDLPYLQRIDMKNLKNLNKSEIISELQKIDYNHGKKIVIVVLDKKTKHLYPAIKDFIYTQTGLASQFMLHDENQRGGKKKQSLSYYSGVLNQMVVKANGELFKIKFSEEIDKNPSMIIGIDYSKLKVGTKYVVTATYNRRFNKVYTDMKINLKNEESENEIKNKALIDLISEAINFFKKSNSERKPCTVIIYMKGGNEKQTERIVRFILPDIVNLFSGNKNENCYEEGYKPKLTVFSVNKRTELKFFEKARNGYKNIPLGSVIDQKVVNPDVFEFYLQCPEVQLGSASPVHFWCIYNNNENITLDDYEKITFYQSFYYWNWPGPVRIPAVLKYAELANSFSSKNLKNDVLKNLKSTPYYI